MRNPFAILAKRDTTRPSLREHAASLKASAARVIRREPKGALPEAGSQEGIALFHAAITETDRLSHDAVHGYPELKRTDLQHWTCTSLQKALEAGEIAPTEAAPLYRLAAEREHRIRAAALATDAGALQILAYAGDYSRAAAAPEGEPDTAEDPIFAAIHTTRGLTNARSRAASLPQPAGSIDPLPEQTAATEAFFAHVDGVLLKTVPTTATGCAALARYAVEFLADEGYVLDEQGSEHVRILELIARSPLLDGASPVRPPVPDFSGLSSNTLIRTYEAFRHAFDIASLTTWTVHDQEDGNRILDAELDRLSHLQNDIADELARRSEYDGSTSAGRRFDTLIHRAVARGEYEDAARFASEADAARC